MEEWKRKEMHDIFDSLEPELLEDMRRLDYRLKTIATECSLFGIPIEEVNKEQKKRVFKLLEHLIDDKKNDRKIGRRFQ
jgi:hypothetical protein